MIKSMTAFARKDAQDKELGSICWELRSVNHRFLEMSFRLPESFRDVEYVLRDHIKQHVLRGKVEIFLRYQFGDGEALEWQLNHGALQQIKTAIATIQLEIQQPLTLDASRLLGLPGLIQKNEIDLTRSKQWLVTIFEAALLEFNAARCREGEKLAAIIQMQLKNMMYYVNEIKQQKPAIIQQQRERLQERLKDLEINCSIERLEQEIGLLIQKSDVTEELDRLEIHIQEMSRTLNQHQEGVGRRLDFLAQEMNREANTLGSKSVSIINTQAAVELKVLIEQVREQIQNIE